jgi:hypothetical protein
MRAMNLRLGFALGNLLPALVLGAGCYALPLRWWGMDVPVALVVLGLLASTAIALRKPSLAPRVLRFAALALLVLGLGLLAAFGLCVAFLSGIHGPFGAFGSLLMGLVVLLITPYAVLYPAFQLWWLGREARSRAVSSAGSAT